MQVSLNKDVLMSLYYNQKLSLREIGVRFGKSASWIQILMERYGLPRRPSRGGGGPKKGRKLKEKTKKKMSRGHGVKYLPSRKELHTLYWIEKKSTIDLAELFHVNKKTILRWMKKHNVPRRNLSEAAILRAKSKGTLNNILDNVHIRPTQLERKVMEIIKDKNLSFRYTGDWSFLIGRLNPDFVATNGEKVVLEVFGNYWHNPDSKLDIPYEKTEEGRKKVLAKYGWKCIVIWEHEVENPSGVVAKIKNFFMHNEKRRF